MKSSLPVFCNEKMGEGLFKGKTAGPRKARHENEEETL